MSKIDEILKKSLQGKIATDSKLGSEQEPYASNALVDYAAPSSLAQALNLPPMKDARFLGSTPRSYSNRLVLRPSNVPRRFRRWVEPALVFGADLFCEGANLDVTGTATLESLDDVNFSGNFAQSPHFGVITDTFVLLHDATNFTNDNAKSNLKAFSVSSTTLDELDIATAGLNITDGNSQYRWSHYGFYPPQLLPLPNSDGEVTAYAAIIPEDWPVISWTREFFDLTFGSALTKANVASINVLFVAQEQVVIENPTGSLVEDEFVLLQGIVFHVESVSNAGPNDLSFLTPIHPFDYDGVQPVTGTTLQTLYTVSELIADPTDSPGQDASGNTIPALYDSPFLDWIRVRRLHPPIATDRNRSLLGAFIDSTPSDKIGFAPALIPATAGGARELAVNGVTEFSSVILNPDVSDDQEILLDYREGIFHLSHPIVTGSTLNPNSYLDGNGYPRLYAVFTAYNRDTVPTTVTQLQRGGQKTGVTSVPGSSVENSPVSGLQGWKVTLGDEQTSIGDYYYYPPGETGDTNPPIQFGGRNEAIYLLESNTAHEDGPLMVFQKRSDVDGRYMVGALAYNGNGAQDPEDVSQFSFFPDIADNAATGLTLSNRADFRVGTSRQVVDVTNSLYYSVTPGDLLEGTINGIEFSIALIDDAADAADAAVPATGINATDGQRSIPEIIADITAKMPGTLTFGQDYSLDYVVDGTDYLFVFEGSRTLEITQDDANLFGGATAVPEDIKLTFGYNGAVEAILRYFRTSNELLFDGAGIRVQGTRLGVPGPAIWVSEGFDVLDTDTEAGTVYVSLEPGTVITPAGPVRIAEETRVALAPDQRVGLYLDTTTGTIQTVNQVGTEDSPFQNIGLSALPLYIVKTSASPDVTYTVDCRDFFSSAHVSTNLTVGNDGRFSTLAGAIEYAKYYSESSKGRGVIELLQGTTLVLDEVNSGAYVNVQPTPYDGAPIGLPNDVLFLGNGYTVEISGVPSETAGFGDPIFRSNQNFNPGVAGISDVEFRDINFEVAVGQPDPVSLMAGNFENNGRVILTNVRLEGNGIGEQFNLYGSTNASDSLQKEVIISNCVVDGDLRIRSCDRLIVRDLTHLGIADPSGTMELVTRDDAYVHMDGIQSKSTASEGYFMTISPANDVNLHLSNVEASVLTLQPPTGVSTTGLFATLNNLKLGTRCDFGSSSPSFSLGGTILVDGVYIDTTATITAMNIRRTQGVDVKNVRITSAANITIDVTDSDFSISNYTLNNTSVAASATGKVGIRLQGDNGSDISGVNAMDSDIIIESGEMTVTNGSGIYILRANEAGKRTLIRNNRFVQATNSTSYRAVLFNADGGSPTGENVDNVYIAHNIFDAYAVTGADNFAVGTQGTPTGNLGDVTIVFNHVRGFVGGASDFGNTAGLVKSNNAFTV